jgi:hypothetical protein
MVPRDLVLGIMAADVWVYEWQIVGVEMYDGCLQTKRECKSAQAATNAYAEQ